MDTRDKSYDEMDGLVVTFSLTYKSGRKVDYEIHTDSMGQRGFHTRDGRVYDLVELHPPLLENPFSCSIYVFDVRATEAEAKEWIVNANLPENAGEQREGPNEGSESD